MPRDPHVLHRGHAPTPFTADEIRDGSPAGKTVRVRIEEDGSPPRIRLTRFVEVDAEGSVQEYSEFDLDGRPLGAPERRRSRWLDLQDHASSPAAATTITREVIESPLGSLACSHYRVVHDDEVHLLWFADAIPGMPVRLHVEAGNRVVYRSEMIERSGTSDPATG